MLNCIWSQRVRKRRGPKAMWNDLGKVAPEDAPLSPVPDVILPSQFFELVGGVQRFSSEQRLMLAVLIDAINVLVDSRVLPNRRKRNSFNEASSWVFAERIISPLSFDHVCDALNVDAESLRRRLSELLSEQSGTGLRLRLKAGGRMQCMTVNRVHGRKRRRRALRSQSCLLKFRFPQCAPLAQLAERSEFAFERRRFEPGAARHLNADKSRQGSADSLWSVEW